MRSRLFSRLLLPAAIFFAAIAPVAQAAVQNRIVSAVNSGSRVALPGNISGHVKHSADLGMAPGDRQLESLSVRFNMTPAQQTDLNQLLAAQLNPSSPSYHQWLTPEQFGARFGLSSSDIAKVSSWLTSQGFAITSVARSSNLITFTGTVAQAEQAFGTAIHSVSLDGEQHISNVTDPTLPAAISGVVTAITGLNDFRLKPRSRARNVSVDPSQPLFTQASCPPSTTPCHYIAPADFYTIYDVNPLITNGITGAGVTIAVVGQTDLTVGSVLPDANITAFRSAAGLPPISLKLQFAGGKDPGISQGDIDESHIDIEWSSATAPGATILFVYGFDVFSNSLAYAITNKVAPIITSSYGLCESAWGTSSLASTNQLLAQANAQGQTVVSSSGDAGATDCDVAGAATEGLTVDFPGSSPYVTSAGGTMFSGDVSTPNTYWSSSNGTNGGSALSYIPEQPWNETTATGALTAGGAGGGGTSAYFSKPVWQVGTGVPSDSSRDTPDFSLNAAAIHDGYLVCSQGDGMNEPACTNGFLGSGNTVNVFGGTSFVAPTFAGILALVEQKLGGAPNAGIGNVGPVLYGYLNGPTYSSVFHDIITGNNSVPCAQGTANCPNGGSIGFSAGTGYDQASGIGSFDVTQLVNGWSTVTPTGTGSTIGAGVTTTSVTTTSAICAVSGTGTIPLSVTVTGSITGTTPTGTVQFFVDNVAVAGAPTALSGGTASYTLNTSTLSSGGHNISAVYSGDGNFAGSKGTLLGPNSNPMAYPNGPIASVDIVSSSSKDFSFTPCTGTGTAVTVQPGATATGVTLTVTPANGFTGTISLTVTNNDSMAATTTFSPTSLNITSSAGVTTSFVVTAFQSSTAHLGKPGLKPTDQHPSGKAPWYVAGSGATLACLFLFTFPRRRRWGALLAVLISAAALAAVGCGGNTSTTGGGGGGGGGNTNAQAGTYTFTVTAASGSLVHSTQVTVTVP